MKTEPSLIVGAISSVIMAIAGTLVAFGIDFSDAQRDAIIGVVAAVVPFIFIVSAIIRQTVYAPQTVEQIKRESVKAGEVGGAAPVIP